MLTEQGTDGSFLVRPSNSQPGDFTLSVRQGDSVVHVSIQNTGDYLDLHGGEQFATLVELVECYYKKGGVMKQKGGKNLYLKHPLSSADPTTERWYHGLLPGRDAEMMLLASRSDGSYLVRGSRSKPGDFVLSVRTGKEVSHVMIECKDDKYRIGDYERFDTLADLVEHYKEHGVKQVNGSVIKLIAPLKATHITASGIDERIKDLQKSGSAKGAKKSNKGFREEFAMLQQQVMTGLDDMKNGISRQNTAKNRYKNILPFDFNRVVLTEGDPNVPRSDYINASIIRNRELPDSKRYYIATQGCLETTVADFWRMIWQQNSRIVVMTTKLIEMGRKKCVMYWPLLDSSHEIELYTGKLTIINISERHAEHYDVRELGVSFRSNDPHRSPEPTRKIYHFHFQGWPDHGVPSDPGCVLGFLQDIDGIHESIPGAGPIVLHCSAGIGRTGTVLVIDMILQQIKQQGLDCEIDVQKMTLMVRAQRSGMVQTEAQYRFIYMAVRHYIDTTLRRMQTGQRGHANDGAAVYQNIDIGQTNAAVYQNIEVVKTNDRPRIAPRKH
ncbi:hypothetical protein NP493_5g04009 [Ridgeia piscesae]|uniref:protein-tyrosine-phosphatase n=1 Tax=Ridgeia piscesae TaxID=27915 RepID=A0AAD9PFV6_RIDPI|nr:hypothetical protein NP493_5g04009 [Ridgeia piscesae]